MAEGPGGRLRPAARLFAWSVAIGWMSAVLQALAALGLSASIGGIVAHASSDLGQAGTGLTALSVLLASTTFGVTVLAGLAAELPLRVGFLGGLLAALIPAVVLALGEGLHTLGPATLAALRAAGALMCAGAGVWGLKTGRRIAR